MAGKPGKFECGDGLILSLTTCFLVQSVLDEVEVPCNLMRELLDFLLEKLVPEEY